MTRVNRPDTLLTELRELRRRLRLLESSRMRAAAPAAAMRAVEGTPLLPARPSDWPSTDSADWEVALDGSATAGNTLVIRTVADQDTTGTARVTVDGNVVGDEIFIASDLARHTVFIDRVAEIAVEVRRTSGSGSIRLQAWLT
ncbi:hypothetical protein JOF56_003978 [Kibdelosporangium banguiense]|uniref:Uncharacterized protein n=1 Tax=Kibdelosporangium banguiense TaxID=1365924 RepID=A0ABS4TGN8_9PSEU|nr:hypothetical protein [Kibdelosporangium banguiense]MBP2323593.1 hypothetical protein [Kibdelosporangium banguiense]